MKLISMKKKKVLKKKNFRKFSLEKQINFMRYKADASIMRYKADASSVTL